MEVGAIKQAFNNEVILLKNNLKQAKIQVIHKLTRKAKTLTERKIPDSLKDKLKRKAESAVKEVLIIKKIKARDIAKFIVTHEGKLNEYLNKPTVDENKACARLLLHKSMTNKYKLIRSRFSNISINDLLMSRQERRKLKKEAREEQKNKKKKQNGAKADNVGGVWDVEMSDKPKLDIKNNDDESVSSNADNVSDTETENDKLNPDHNGDQSTDNEEEYNVVEKVISDDDLKPEYTKLLTENTRNNEIIKDTGDTSSKISRKLNHKNKNITKLKKGNLQINSDVNMGDNNEMECKSESVVIIKHTETNVKQVPNNNDDENSYDDSEMEKFDTSDSSNKMIININMDDTKKIVKNNKSRTIVKKVKDNTKNKNLNEKLLNRNFNKKSGEDLGQMTKIADPFFVTSTGENYMSLVEPRLPDEVKDVHKQGNRQYRRAVMFGNVPKSKPRNTGYKSHNNSNQVSSYNNNKSFNKTYSKPEFDTQLRNKGTEIMNSKDETVPEKLHPSWEAKKRQSTIVPFKGKKIMFDDS